ncbi:hypothetical protein BH11ACT3_BH11ACT3_22240 [soil metagenome]
MRWDNLFDDLESQLEQELGAEEVDLLAEEERLRLSRLSLRERIGVMTHGPAATPLRIELRDRTRIVVSVSTVGRDWFAGDVESPARRSVSCVVPVAAVAALFPSADQLARTLDASVPTPSPTSLSTRLGLTFVLRDLCRRRAGVDLSTAWGRLHGTIDRVGRDHLDLAEHERGASRRPEHLTGLRVLPLAELLIVRF